MPTTENQKNDSSALNSRDIQLKPKNYTIGALKFFKRYSREDQNQTKTLKQNKKSPNKAQPKYDQKHEKTKFNVRKQNQEYFRQQF